MHETLSVSEGEETNQGCGVASSNGSNGNYGNLIHQLIESQQQLTAVERFSQRHSDILSPALAPQYKDLIPLELPGEDEQYSFEVDLDACSGCKACVAACHNLNGLEDGELWRNVGLLTGGTETEPEIQHVTSACHHCLEPACMLGCPVNAYEKDAVTGIVAHLDDQCIGCKYCMFMCPYDVPSYSESKGIVRKCNMCADRLEVGEAPACVQACPNQAIKIKKVSRSEIIDSSDTLQLVPGSPNSKVTLPTTNYATDRVLADNLLSNDYYVAKPLHAHFPLVFMLTLTQMAFGIFATTFAVTQFFPAIESSLQCRLDLLAFGVLVMGLNVALLHLGRPLKAYRAMAGIRTSWLSREIAGFNAFAGTATMLLAWGWLDQPTAWTGVPLWVMSLQTTIFGAIAIACSAMLYIITKRPLWTALRTNVLFFLTSAILGTATVAVAISFLASDSSLAKMITPESPFVDAATLNAACSMLAAAVMLFVVIKIAYEASIFSHLKSTDFTPWFHAAKLMSGDLKWTTATRYLLAVVGGVIIPLIFLLQISFGGADGTIEAFGGNWILMGVGLIVLVAAELVERYLFFAVSVARRMPGAPN